MQARVHHRGTAGQAELLSGARVAQRAMLELHMLLGLLAALAVVAHCAAGADSGVLPAVRQGEPVPNLLL